MKPICVPCRRFFRMEKAGYYFVEGMPTPGQGLAEAGNRMPERWAPYKLWVGDLWKCPDCDATILSGFGREQISEHYKPDFYELCRTIGGVGSQLQVNDC